MASETLLIVFAKQPVSGAVKTRLCPPLSPAQAAGFYEQCLNDIVGDMRVLPGLDLALAFTPREAKNFFQTLAPGTRLFPQEGRDLGERLTGAFARSFAEGYGSVLIRNSDSPDLPGSLVTEARDLLSTATAQVVLGPSPDGGYYLVGLGGPQPELFSGVPWSSPRTLTATLDRAARLRLAVRLLPPWPDIDTWADLAAFARRSLVPPAPGWRSHGLARQLVASTAAPPR